MASERKAVLVTRRTRLEELIARFHTVAQAKFYVEHLGADFADYEAEHATYLTARQIVEAALARRCRVQKLERSYLPNYLFAPDDVVIALGQDGVVANTLKYLDQQPLVGVNPDPTRFDGVLLPFKPADVVRVLDAVLADKRPSKGVTLAIAKLSDGQTLRAVNDLFIGPKTHTSARYEIQLGERREVQSSSGLIVSTGLGSTAWLRSIVTGSQAIASANAGAPVDAYRPMPWDSPTLRFAVREPFPSVSTGTSLVYGDVDAQHPLTLHSRMAENGVIFSDGLENDYLQFNAGITATVTVDDRVGRLIQ